MNTLVTPFLMTPMALNAGGWIVVILLIALVAAGIWYGVQFAKKRNIGG